jgi:choice-of-anchor C domain-containing protein
MSVKAHQSPAQPATLHMDGRGWDMQGLKRSVVLPAILLLISTAAHANLLVNGDFSQGPIVRHGWKPVPKGKKTILAWHVKQNSVDYVTTYWQQPTGAVASIDMNGTATKRNESPNQPGVLAQSFATDAGTSYQVTFYLSANPAGGPAERTMVVKVGSTRARFHWNIEKERNTLSDMKWKPETVAFTATAASTELKFISTTKSGVFGPAIALVSVDAAAPAQAPTVATAVH